MIASLKAVRAGDRLSNDLLMQMRSGMLKPSDRVLPETQLAALYNISLRETRNALTNLQREGLVSRKQGRGTFVTEQALLHPSIHQPYEIAVLCFDIVSEHNVFFQRVWRGITQAARTGDCTLHIHPVEGRTLGLGKGLLREMIIYGHINGLLIMSWLERAEIESLLLHEVPCVAAGFEYRELDVPCALSDCFRGVELSVGFLLRAHHTKIGILTGTPGVSSADVRLAQDKTIRACEDILRPLGLYRETFVKKGVYSEAEGFRMAGELLDNAERPTALVTSGNELTRGALKAAAARGLRVPNDLAVVGIVADAEDFPRPLVLEPIEAIGATALRMLRSLLRGEALDQRKAVLKPELKLL